MSDKKIYIPGTNTKIRQLRKTRPISETEFEKPERKDQVTERVTQNTNPMNTETLIKLGRMIKPDGLIYLGSAAVHFYAPAILLADQNNVVITHYANLNNVPETLALRGSKELGRKLMIAFGHKPPARTDEKTKTKLDI